MNMEITTWEDFFRELRKVAATPSFSLYSTEERGEAHWHCSVYARELPQVRAGISDEPGELRAAAVALTRFRANIAEAAARVSA